MRATHVVSVSYAVIACQYGACSAREDAFSIDRDAQPVLTPVTGGSHFHSTPGAPHAFLPKAGKPVPDDWEIAFIAITPRNLREDTQNVPEAVRSAYRDVVGMEAPQEA